MRIPPFLKHSITQAASLLALAPAVVLALGLALLGGAFRRAFLGLALLCVALFAFRSFALLRPIGPSTLSFWFFVRSWVLALAFALALRRIGRFSRAFPLASGRILWLGWSCAALASSFFSRSRITSLLGSLSFTASIMRGLHSFRIAQLSSLHV